MTENTRANGQNGKEERNLGRTLFVVGWIILAIAVVIALVLRYTDHYGFISGFVLMFVYPLISLAATATGTTGSVHGYTIALVAVVAELGVLMSMTWDMSVFVLYCCITLVCALIGYGIGLLLHRHYQRENELH